MYNEMIAVIGAAVAFLLVCISILILRRVKKQISEMADILEDVKHGNGNRRILSETHELLGFPGLSLAAILKSLVQIIFNCLFLYIAVMPIIALAVRIPNGHMIGTIIAFVYGYGVMFTSGNRTVENFYPVAASLGLVDYRSHDAGVNWNIFICIFSIATALVISAAFVFTTKLKESVLTKRGK